tara:strand:+ start:224 stop:436 length:213 start_codon:yes stop_codon:yes gene_type:complete
MSDKELIKDYKKMQSDIRKSKEEFDMFVSNLYIENCHERSEHGMPLYSSCKEYYEQNQMFIEKKYFEQNN